MNGPLAILIAYLIGGIPFGYLVVRWKRGEDIRGAGSGNIGATNVLRTAGRALGVLTLLLDMLKAVAAVWLADYLTGGSRIWMSAAALAVMFGHIFPVFLKFRGGKAVASFVGAFLYLTPLPMVATLLVFVIAVWRTRFISLGSVLAAILFPLAVWLIEHPPLYVIGAAVVAGALIVWRHTDNLARLRAGKESSFRFGGQRV